MALPDKKQSAERALACARLKNHAVGFFDQAFQCREELRALSAVQGATLSPTRLIYRTTAPTFIASDIFSRRTLTAISQFPPRRQAPSRQARATASMIASESIRYSR